MPAPQTLLTALQLVTPVLPTGTTTLSVDSSVLPLNVLGDSSTVRLEISIYNSTTALSSFTPIGAKNQFTTSLALIPTVQETVVQLLGRNYDPAAFWLASLPFAASQRIQDPNGNVEVVVAPGISGTAQPTWSTIQPAAVTKVAILNNTLTVSCNNGFSAGQQAYLAGLVNATFLNGLLVTVVSEIPGVQFTAAFNHADYTPTPDSGLAHAVTADNGALWANFGPIAVTPTVKFSLLFFQSGLAVAIAPPSGIVAKKNQTDCTLEWVTPDFPGFIGVRVMISTDPAGVNPPYVQLGGLVTAIERDAQTTISTQSATAVTVPTANIANVAIANNILTIDAINRFLPNEVLELSGLTAATFLNGQVITVLSATGTQFTAAFTHGDYASAPDVGIATSIVSTSITTSTNTVLLTNFSSVNVPFTTVNNNVFYALFSTVIQDPTTNAIYESVQNGPLTCGFVNLKVVNPTDFPVLQRKEDIAGRLISQVTRQRPDLDLSPRSEIRDIFIDPFSIEVSNMSVREWFARVSQSISAISQVDDSTGTGVSDPFQASQYKQQIARAYGLSATDTQSLINEQFDILGEQAGLTRLSPSASTVVLTFYTFQQPQASLVVPQGAVVGTAGDSNTPSLTFTTLGSGTIDFTNLASFFNPVRGFWAISVPAQCTQTGSVGNVGAGTITQAINGLPAGVNVTNLAGAQFGTDQESNSSFAARIQARLVTGVDTGTRHGYLVTALSTPGIIDAEVVAAGDVDMIREWDPIRQKHVFGAVDIYTRGTTFSQQDEIVAFAYQTAGTHGVPATYLPITFTNGMKFHIPGFGSLPFPLYAGVELLVQRTVGSFFLGLTRAQFDNIDGSLILSPADMAYQYVGSPLTQAKVPLTINGNPASNQTALAALAAAAPGTYTFLLTARFESPFIHTPALQPVLAVFSVTGQSSLTGSLPSSSVNLIHTSDFLLNGGSNDAGDQVQVAITSAPATVTIAAQTAAPAQIDTGMDVPLDSNGTPLDVLSVRSADLSTLYRVGADYKVAPIGNYHTYGLQILSSIVQLSHVSCTGNVLTVTAPNEFGPLAAVTFSAIPDPVVGPILNGQTVIVATATATQFTATFGTNFSGTQTTGNVTGSAIQNGQSVVVAYNKFALFERLTLVPDEPQTLNGSLPTTLNHKGFVRNTWLPESHSRQSADALPADVFHSLILDGWDGSFGPDGGLDAVGSSGLVGAGVARVSRYIKVTFNNGVSDVVKRENIDFTLNVDPVSGTATLTRIVTGSIPDGGTVKVSYFCTEPFTFSTQFPAFVEVLASQVAQTKHAAADVLVKAMVASPVDITMAVTLNPNASASAIDPVIRTVVNIVLDNATGTLFQSELIRQVQAITGVKSVQVPLIKCAKSDASYDIGVVVPTGTAWIPLAQDPLFANLQLPQNAWISVSPVLPDSTIPSGGEPDAVVDFFYQGQAFRRALSVADFLQNSPPAQRLASTSVPGSFYIVGLNDRVNPTVPLPASYQQKVLLVVPQDVVNPGNLSYLCTYQVFNETGAKDVTVSATEFLAPGRITINFVAG